MNRDADDEDRDYDEEKEEEEEEEGDDGGIYSNGENNHIDNIFLRE